MDPINLKKLAEQLNLSISTVSKAFQDAYDINPQTRERVLAKARELNYQPNIYASNLRRQRSKTIAVVLPQIANNFFTQAINGIESVARDSGYHVLFYLTHEQHEKEVAFIGHLQNGRVDGVLVSVSDSSRPDSHLELLRQRNIPLVNFDRVYESSPDAKVITNNYESSYEGTMHLIEQGCKRIGHLYYSGHLSISNQRLEGYRKALKDAGIPYREDLLLPCDSMDEKNIPVISNWMRGSRLDGLFSSFEKLALQSYTACRLSGIRIPQDLKVLSYSNLEIAELLDPSMTTIAQPAFEIGRQAAKLLFRLLSKGGAQDAGETVVIPSVLHRRRSTALE